MRRPATRAKSVPPATAGLGLAILLLLPGAVPLAAPDAPTAAPASFLAVPPDAWSLLTPWILDGSGNHSLPTTLPALLDLLAPTLPAGASAGWEAYFAANGLVPTEDERAALARFQAASPHLAREAEVLAADLARAALLRERAFAALTPEQWAILPGALAALSAGVPPTTPQALALAAVEPQPLLEGAALLARAGLAARPALVEAQAKDAALGATLPQALRDPATLTDPAAILAILAGDARPVTTDLSAAEVSSALEALGGLALTRPRLHLLPADLDAPLADILAATARLAAGASPTADREMLATLAANIAPLTRASANLTSLPQGALSALGGGPRPLAGLKATGHSQPSVVLEDLLGVGEAPTPASLPEGYAALQASFGRAVSREEESALSALAARLGPDLSGAVGTLLLAQARYQTDLSPDSPVPARAALAGAHAQPILASGAPLTLDDLRALQEASDADAALRDLVARRAGALAQAILQTRSAPPVPVNAPTPENGVGLASSGLALRQGGVVVLDEGASTLEETEYATAPVLLLDLGGDDTYRIPLAGVIEPRVVAGDLSPAVTRTSVAIDLGGNDLYQSPRDFTLGAAAGLPTSPTFAFLLDVDGNDHYRGPDSVMGWGVDAFGFLVDLAGNDDYEASGRGLAGAGTTAYASHSLGMVMDGQGNDWYSAGEGYARMDRQNQSLATFAVFLEISGNDTYEASCPRDPMRECFALPRPDFTSSSSGTSVFVNVAGEDDYPRPTFDPHPTPVDAATVPPGMGNLVINFQRFVVVQDFRASDSNLYDDDGDIFPNQVERLLGGDPQDPSSPSRGLGDTDNDGFIDLLESLLGTDSGNASSRPLGLPSAIGDVPLDGLPFQDGRNLLLDVPALVAIGLPGETRYDSYHLLSIDLGLDERDRDTYLGKTALNGFALDLGGNDRYTPQAVDGNVPPGLGAVASDPALVRGLPRSNVAALVDLGGNDLYEGGVNSQAAAMLPHSLAVFLDAGGSDTHRALRGESQAYSRSHGSAYFFDLAGDDDYVAPSQGLSVLGPLDELMGGATIDNESAPGRAAVFLDLSGDDTYDAGPLARSASKVDDFQGRAAAPPRTDVRSTFAPVAAFLDLDGDDRHLVLDDRTGEVVDVSAQREDRLRVNPLEAGPGDAVEMFLDAPTGSGRPGSSATHSDSDGVPDAVEIAAGTDPHDADDRPTTGDEFLLRLPRLGLAVGDVGGTSYREGQEYALQIDIGGDDVYRNRVGASTPRFPAALALDLAGDDSYESALVSNLSQYAAPRLSAQSPGTASFLGYEDALVGSAQGAGVFGVGVLVDAGGVNAFRAVHASSCARCSAPATLLGVSQGAGLLGVGILALPEGADPAQSPSTFSASVSLFSGLSAEAIARTHAQGAGVAGVGILAKDDGRNADTYLLEAEARGMDLVGNAATSGQGYGLKGMGVLLDSGGDNRFTAGDLAQAAADDASVNGTRVPTTLLPEFNPAVRLEGASGWLLLPGMGNDTLRARARSQAYASSAASAILLDAGGDDLRVLTPRLAGAALGQAAAVENGFALLLDQRGNDANFANGSLAQGFADRAFAFLVDLSGADTYRAYSMAQAHVDVLREWRISSVPSQTSGASFATLLDRTGNDLYALLPGARGQGSVSFNNTGGNAQDPGQGVALFMDLGGLDFYDSSPPQQRPRASSVEVPPNTPGVANSRPEDGNNWQWTVSLPKSAYGKAESTSNVTAVGVDDDKGPGSYAMLTRLAGFAGLDVLQEGATVDGSAQGALELRATFGATAGDQRVVVDPEGIDRAEFYDNGRLLGPGVLRDGFYNLTWNTSDVDARGIPLVPDGRHQLEARLYPRAGTPDDGSGRGAAADAEPFSWLSEQDVDNPPLVRSPVVPGNISTTLGLVTFPLRVDRDLERECLSCLRLGHVVAGGDEWASVATPDPLLPDVEETTCASQCLATVMVNGTGGDAYVSWEPPVPNDQIVGYRVVRVSPTKGHEQIAYVDARVALKVLPVHATPRLWFVDRDPQDATGYAVHTVKVLPTGDRVWVNDTTPTSYAASTKPGAVTGLRATGAEGAVRLAWRAVDDAVSYTITRERPGGVIEPVMTGVSVLTYTDEAMLPDRAYDYRVRAVNAAGESTIASSPARAMASPGHEVEISFEGTPIVIFPNATLGGGQVHEIAWDASLVPDGEYLLKTLITDGSLQHAPNITRVWLDGTAPRTLVSLPSAAGGKYLASSTLRIPFRVVETVSGVNQTAFFFRLDQGEWSSVIVNSSQGVVVYNNPRDGATLSVLAVSVDKVGNLEGLTTRTPWKPTFQDAFLDRLARREYTTHVLDTSPPSGIPGSLSLIVQPGALVPIVVDATDRGTGIVDAYASLGESIVPLTSLGSGRYVGQWEATGSGRLQVSAFLTDQAGNTGRVPLGTVVVDADPPTISEAAISFPGARVVGRPGQTATLQVVATDPQELTPEGELTVVADVSNVSSVTLLPLRYDAALQAYVGAFPANRVDGNGVANITVDATDKALQRSSRTVEVRLNGTAAAMSVPTVLPGPDRLLFNWTTVEPLRARVDYGLSPQLGQSSAVGPLGKSHTVDVRALKPDATYFAKAVVITESGVETASPLLQLRTEGALNVTLVPVEGLPDSNGQAGLRALLARFDLAPISNATVDVVLEGPRGSPRIVGSAPVVDGQAATTLDLAGVRDGAYALVLEAREGDLKGRSEPYRVVVDRTRPLVDLPLEARSVKEDATLTVRVEERGSGVDIDRVEWRIGDRYCSAFLQGDSLSCRVPGLGVDGQVEMSLRVPDRAGNVATLDVQLALDSAAPVLDRTTLASADGFPSLRPGAPARLSVEVEDLGVSRVVADLTSLGGASAAELRRVQGTRYEVVFPVKADQPEGAVRIPIFAYDHAGHVTPQTAASVVDATAANMLRASVLPQGPTAALLVIDTDEPARVTVRVGGGPVFEEPVARRTQIIQLTGLAPGVPVRGGLIFVDEAGHRSAATFNGGVLPDTKAPGAVTGLRVEDDGDGRLVIRWGEAPDDAGIAAYRIVRQQGALRVPLPNVTDTRAEDVVPIGVPVRYTVIPVDHGGNEGEAVSVDATSFARPQLSGGLVDPPTGGPGIFAFRVQVRDASGKAPAVFVRVDDVAHPMRPDKDDCREGCVYEALVQVNPETLASGPHRFSFEAGGSSNPVRFPSDEAMEGPIVLQSAPGTLSGVLSAARQVPTVGIATAGLALASVALALWLRRRRS